MQQTNYRAFSVLVMVFFFWGFVAASNDILIPVFKEKLHLQQWQSQMISFAFYVAYTVGSIIYYAISKISGMDILNRLGYKNGLILGLLISASGTLLFLPAAQTESFGLMITGLFIVGIGFSLQQTAANPLAIALGSHKTGAQRLSMAGGVNNVGTTLGPILVSLAIFGTVGAHETLSNISGVKTPYLILGAAFVVVALLIKISPIPGIIQEIDEPHSVRDEKHSRSALSFPQLTLGMIAIFLYVGVEVSTASNLPEYMRQYIHVPTGRIAPYVSLFWASLMIGRWTASVGAFSVGKERRSLLTTFVPYLAFGLFLLVNFIAGHDISIFLIYAAVIPVLIIADLLSRGDPARQLLIFSLFGIASLLIGMWGTGLLSVFAFISVGLFCSTLWPCIFALAINGLGKHTNEGSGFLIMMIMGGGFVSLFQGWLASDEILGIRFSYFAGVGCFAYLAFYALKMIPLWRKGHHIPKHPDMIDS